jgi:hypothetical protein
MKIKNNKLYTCNTPKFSIAGTLKPKPNNHFNVSRQEGGNVTSII